MMTTETMPVCELTDAELVTQSLAGDRDAFRQIVERHQSLLCALAYSATGSLSQSEEIAQEAFVTAWQHLARLDEPAKLRAWLCSIARHRIGKFRRHNAHEPIHQAEPLDAIPESPTSSPLPSEAAISKEEEAILWRSVEKIPQIYREPVVLFYREHRSIQQVAADLELSEEAVRQRLSRGRRQLHEQVQSFVEGALERSNPGKAFTVGVLAALPALSLSAQAATLGATAAKAGAMAKSAGLLGVFSAFLGLVGMGVGTYCGYRLDQSCARSPERLAFIRRYYRVLVGCMAGFGLGLLVLTIGGFVWGASRPALYIGLFAGWGVAYLIAVAALVWWLRRSFQRIGQQEKSAGRPVSALTPVYEYRSRRTLLGWPLVHIRLRGGMDRGLVTAWIAVGDSAVGLLAACGGIAIAPVSLGGFALGLLPLGGFALGIVALGGFSLGIWSAGGLAAGWQAFGGLAVAWNAALGGAALAHDFAVGGIAQALQANNDTARWWIQQHAFFEYAQVVCRYLGWLNLIWLVPLLLWWRTIKQPSPVPGTDRSTTRG